MPHRWMDSSNSNKCIFKHLQSNIFSIRFGIFEAFILQHRKTIAATHWRYWTIPCTSACVVVFKCKRDHKCFIFSVVYCTLCKLIASESMNNAAFYSKFVTRMKRPTNGRRICVRHAKYLLEMNLRAPSLTFVFQSPVESEVYASWLINGVTF